MNDNDRIDWVRAWRRRHGGHRKNGLAPHALKLLEEVVELCYAAGASAINIDAVVSDETRKQSMRGTTVGGDADLEAVGEEIADVALCLDVVCLESGRHVDAEVSKKIPVLETRRWTVDDDGVLRRPR